MKSAWLASFVSRWLPQRARSLEIRRLGGFARRLRRFYDDYQGDVDTVLHGFPARINAGNPYPFLIARLPTFNRPLVELTRQVWRHHQRPLTMADVGAAIGDTVLLLQQQVPGSIGQAHCIEPSARFAALLRHNTARFSGTVVHERMLGRSGATVRTLVHHHAGTAAACGAERVPAATLDEVLLPAFGRLDLLKIDIDGSDGEALAGATNLLTRDQPAIIFEWHPQLFNAAGNDPFVPFEVLARAGYRRLLWFRNEGGFSHFSSPTDPEIPVWEGYLRRMQPHGDPHFDIVALPPSMDHLAEAVASAGAISPRPAG